MVSSSGESPTGLSCSFLSCRLWCGFLIELPKSVEPQLSDRSPVSHRSQPTSFSCYCGQSSLLVRPATAPFSCTGWNTEGDRGIEAYEVGGKTEEEKKERGRDAEREHICQNSSKTLGEAGKAVGSCSWSRWSERARERKGGRVIESKVREALLFSLAQRERERDREWGDRFIIHVCEIRIKLNRLLGIILRDFPTWG